MAPRISLATYKQRQSKLGAGIGVRALQLLRPFRGQSVTETDVVRVATDVFPQVREDRVSAAALGTALYMSQRVEFLGEEADLEAPVEDYGVRNLVTGLSAFMRPGEEFTADVEAASLVSRHVKTAARRQVVGLSLVDRDVLGWARTSGGTTSCSFCLMLIGRGPVYRSRQSAGDMKRFHNRCDCVVVPVFDRGSFPGRDEWLHAESMWSQSTRGKSGRDALKAFRDRVSSSAPGGQDAATAA